MSSKIAILTLETLIFNNTGIVSHLIDSVNGKIICNILERPFLNNIRNVSAIPYGTYFVEYLEDGSEKFPYSHFEVTEVSNRSAILIHSGNTIDDTEGCLLTGGQITISAPTDDNKLFISDSRDNLNILIDYLVRNYDYMDFYLEILDKGRMVV